MTDTPEPCLHCLTLQMAEMWTRAGHGTKREASARIAQALGEFIGGIESPAAQVQALSDAIDLIEDGVVDDEEAAPDSQPEGKPH